jgi:hypothetical protein
VKLFHNSILQSWQICWLSPVPLVFGNQLFGAAKGVLEWNSSAQSLRGVLRQIILHSLCRREPEKGTEPSELTLRAIRQAFKKWRCKLQDLRRNESWNEMPPPNSPMRTLWTMVRKRGRILAVVFVCGERLWFWDASCGVYWKENLWLKSVVPFTTWIFDTKPHTGQQGHWLASILNG